MVKLLLILLFSTSLSAATLIATDHPYYYFDYGDEIMQCETGPLSQPIKCFGQNKRTKSMFKYECVGVTRSEGYIANCKVIGGI